MLDDSDETWGTRLLEIQRANILPRVVGAASCGLFHQVVFGPGLPLSDGWEDRALPGGFPVERERSGLVGWRGLSESFADGFRGEAHRDGLNRPARLYAKNGRRKTAQPPDKGLEIARVAVDEPGNLDGDGVRRVGVNSGASGRAMAIGLGKYSIWIGRGRGAPHGELQNYADMLRRAHGHRQGLLRPLSRADYTFR